MVEQLQAGKSWDEVFGGGERTCGHALELSDESEDEEEAEAEPEAGAHSRAHAGGAHAAAEVPAAPAADAALGEAPKVSAMESWLSSEVVGFPCGWQDHGAAGLLARRCFCACGLWFCSAHYGIVLMRVCLHTYFRGACILVWNVVAANLPPQRRRPPSILIVKSTAVQEPLAAATAELTVQ